MRRLVLFIGVVILVAASADAEIIVDDFTDGFFEETLVPGEGLSLPQTGLSGVLGGKRNVYVGDTRPIPGPGTVTVGVLERDGGIAVFDSEIYVESAELFYPNVQLDLTDPGLSYVNIDLNLLSLRDSFPHGGPPQPVGLVVDLVDPDRRYRTIGGVQISELGRQTVSLELDAFRKDDDFDPSNVGSFLLAVRTRSGVNIEIDRIYFVPEPASVLSILFGVLPLIGGSRRLFA